jgi:hypothetical protein
LVLKFLDSRHFLAAGVGVGGFSFRMRQTSRAFYAASFASLLTYRDK